MLRTSWDQLFEEYKKSNSNLADQLYRMQHRLLPDGWDKNLPVFPPDAKGLATRDSSAKVLNILAQNVPWLIGGAADLAPSTKTRFTFEGAGDFEANNYAGRIFHFGIREHAMCSILNGLSLSKVRAFGSGFLIFSDYSRPPMRLAALMEIPVIYVFTHDSIGVGEDGPTHQPVEQLASLRALPGFVTIRPADANEVTEGWKVIMQLRHEPAALILTRQAIPTFDRSKYAPASGVAKGAYILADSSNARGQQAPGSPASAGFARAGVEAPSPALPELILMATGSEVSLCLSAYETLTAEGRKVRVVSMPSWEIFEHQSPEYRESVLPAAVTARIAVEQASTFGWAQYVGHAGRVIGMKTFGASAPLKELLKKFGFTPEAVLQAARDMLGKR
jgi:transketolase